MCRRSPGRLAYQWFGFHNVGHRTVGDPLGQATIAVASIITAGQSDRHERWRNDCHFGMPNVIVPSVTKAQANGHKGTFSEKFE